MINEIQNLVSALSLANVPFTVEPLWGGLHLCYPNRSNCVCSVVEHSFSYGGNDDLLEIMGLLTPEEAEMDSVAGYLTAQDVFNRIYTHYKETGKK